MSKKITEATEVLDRRYKNQITNWDEEVAEEELRVKVGIAILKLRQKHNLTQQQLAERMNITQPMLSKLENADYDGSALDMLWRVCKALEVELDFSCREPGTEKDYCDIHIAPATA